MFIVAIFLSVFLSLLCNEVLSNISVFAIILLSKRESVALILLVRVRLVPSNMFEPFVIFLTDLSKVVFLL